MSIDFFLFIPEHNKLRMVRDHNASYNCLFLLWSVQITAENSLIKWVKFDNSHAHNMMYARQK